VAIQGDVCIKVIFDKMWLIILVGSIYCKIGNRQFDTVESHFTPFDLIAESKLCNQLQKLWACDTVILA